MNSKKSLLLLCGAIFSVAVILVVPRLLAQSKPQPNKTQSVCLSDGPNPPGSPLSMVRGKCYETPAGTPEYISKAVYDYGRMAQDIWEDATTKPWEVMQFIGIKPGQKVVDYLPGRRPIVAMYWTRLFYKAVGSTGKVYPFYPQVGCRPGHVLNCMENREYTSSSSGYGARPPETLVGDPRWNGIDEALDIEHTTDFKNLYTLWSVGTEFNLPEQIDVVWSMAHWHDLHTKAYKFDMTDFLARVFESIDTANGVLVIADYTGNPGTGFTQVDTLHRVDKEAVKAEVQKAGFILAGESTVWAKKDDDHTKPVPEESTPGVADMFILKFKKPANAPAPRRWTLEQAAGWVGARFQAVWFNGDWTYQEYPGMYGTWFIDSQGQHILRNEWPPLEQACTGIHYLNDEKHPWGNKKPGDEWMMGTDFSSDDPLAGSFRGPEHLVSLQPTHYYPARPKNCRGEACDIEPSYNDDLSMGHIR